MLPKLAGGEIAELAFVKSDPQKPMTRLVLRLWRSRYRLISGTVADKPIWYGALYQEAFHEPWQLVTLGTTTSGPDASVIPQLLPADMQMLSRSTMQDGSVRRAVLISPTIPEAP
jgi:hypothetical protein